MRFEVIFELPDKRLPTDYRRMFVSFLKKAFEESNSRYFERQYLAEKTKMKNFVFSIYLPEFEKIQEEIIVGEQWLKMFFSSSDESDGLNFYNAVLRMKNKEYFYKQYRIIPTRIRLLQEKIIRDEKAVFKSLSPIVVREHSGDNKKTWFHSLGTEEGRTIFSENLKNQLKRAFSDEHNADFEQLRCEVIQSREIKMKHYRVVIAANSAIFSVEAKPYVLEYLYKSGVGANRSRGFGMLDIIEERRE